MIPKTCFTFVFIVCSLLGFSQQKSRTISGKVRIENVIAPDAVVELKVGQLSKYAVSDKEGVYKFVIATTSDTLTLWFRHVGYQTYSIELDPLQETNQIDINLALQAQNLNEVVIETKEKTINTARKSSYKINNKDFIKNAKATEVLATIPNVFFNENTIVVDGNLTAKIFIDGIEVTSNELKTIDASDIDRVEVINNPSGTYGADFLGAVLNLILKKQSQDFIKGSVLGSRSARFDNWYAEPSISYKRNWLTFKSSFEYKRNNQELIYNLQRNNSGNVFLQQFDNHTKGIQKAAEMRMSIQFSEKSNWNITNYLFGYKFIDRVNGQSMSGGNPPVFFSKGGETGNTNWDIASVYSQKIGEKTTFFYKNKYLVYENVNSANFIYSDGTQLLYDIQSKNRDFYNTLDLESEGLTIFKKNMSFYSGLKYINRRFGFSESNYYVNQNIANIYVELDSQWTQRFSTDLSLIYENTRNSNNIALNQRYGYLLPTLSLLYRFANKSETRFGYSRRLLRPSANDLNDERIVSSPGQARQGNADLLPQIRNYCFITFGKAVQTTSFLVKLYNESISNSIVNTFKLEDNLLVQTLENAAKFNASGMSLGFRTKLAKKINCNLNTGFEYCVYEDNSINALIPKTSGYTFRGNINLSTRVLNDKVFIAFSGSQNGPNYSLQSKSTNQPYFDFRATTNFFKDKVTLAFYAGNIFGNAANLRQVTAYTNFYQRVEIRNNTSNVSLSLSYNFGKKFDDAIDNRNIENDDIRK
jgi:Outer membrane protein beta-barrel family/CarboxypepD_reg-like domain